VALEWLRKHLGSAPRASSRAVFAMNSSATCWQNSCREAFASSGAWPRGVAPQRGPSLLLAMSRGSLRTCGKSGPQSGMAPQKGGHPLPASSKGASASAASRPLKGRSSPRRVPFAALGFSPCVASCRIATSRECSSNPHPPHLSLRHPSYCLPRRQFCLHVPFMLVFSPLRQAGQSFKGLPRGCLTTVQPSGGPHPMWIGAKVGLVFSAKPSWVLAARGGRQSAPTSRRLFSCARCALFETGAHTLQFRLAANRSATDSPTLSAQNRCFCLHCGRQRA